MKKILFATIGLILCSSVARADLVLLNTDASPTQERSVNEELGKQNDMNAELYGKVVTGGSLTGTTLTVTFEDATAVNVDLSGLQDGIGTDDQAITDLSLSGNVISLTLENGGTETVDLTSILGSGGIADAASDGKTYGRKDGVWVEVTGGTVALATDLTNDDTDKAPSVEAVNDVLDLKQNVADVIEADVDDVTLDKTGTTSITLSVKDGGIGPTQLASTTVIAGSYTNSDLTIDDDGRVTAASNGTAGSGAISILGDSPSSPSIGDAWINTTDDKLYVRGDGVTWNSSAFTKVIDDISNSLTMAITDATGTGSTFTVDSIAADVGDTPKTWTGLSSSTQAVTFTPNSTETSSCTGTGLSGSSPNWVANMSSADVTDWACTVSAASGATATYHNEMDSVTNPHTPIIGGSTVVYGPPTISGGGVDFDAPSEAFKATTTISGDAGSVVIQARPHETGWPSANRIYFYTESASIYIRLETAVLRARYGGQSLLYYTNTDFVEDQLVTLRFTWERTGGDVELNLYINEASTPVATSTVTEATFTDKTYAYIGNISGTGAFEANAVIDDVKIYDTAEAP